MSYDQSTVVLRDYWSGNHRPYRNVVHDLNDKQIDLANTLRSMFEEIEAGDGDEVEIVVRKTGNRPFNTVWKLTKPHTYEPVPITAEAEETR